MDWNYETRAVALWIDNDEYEQEFALELARQAQETPNINEYLSDEDNVRVALGESLKARVEFLAPSLPNNLYSDLLNAALGEINWRELADHYLDTLSEQAA